MPCPLIIRLSDGSGIVWDAAAHDLTNYLVGNYPPNYPVPAVYRYVGHREDEYLACALANFLFRDRCPYDTPS